MNKNWVKFLALILIMASGCSFDLKTKEMVNEELKYQSIPVIEDYFNLTYVENHAIAFGVFRNLPRNIRMPVIFILPILTTFVLFYFVYVLRKEPFRLLLPFFFIIAGAYGNIIDRAMDGFVTDFLHVHYHLKYNFYVFNVADVLINIGVILFLFQYKAFNRILDALKQNDQPVSLNNQ